MRAIRVPEAVPDLVRGAPYKTGVEYLEADATCIFYKQMAGRAEMASKMWSEASEEKRAKMLPLMQIAAGQDTLSRHISRDANCDLQPLDRAPLSGERVLFLCYHMGAGDYLLMTPMLRKLKALYPGIEIGVTTYANYASLFRGIASIDEVIVYPMPVAELTRWDFHVNLESLFPKNPRAAEIHASDLFAEAVGISLDGDRRVGWEPGISEMPDWWDAEGMEGKNATERWVGIFVAGSNRAKSWPTDYLIQLTHGLCLSGYSVFWLGAKGDGFALVSMPQGIAGSTLGEYLRGPLGMLDLCGKMPDLCQLGAWCREWLDLIIAPDSFGVHLGGALGIPTLGLYGPFRPELTASQYPSVVPFPGVYPCAPCQKHGAEAECLQNGEQWCGAMNSIRPETIFAEVLKRCPLPQAVPA